MADTAMSYFVEHGLHVNLGLPKWLGNCLVEQGPFQRLISWLSPLALPMEVPFFWFWTHLPPHLRYFILMVPWHFWVLFHKVLPGVLVRRGMVDELSIEAHALGNILYWVRLIPVTKRRMRFSLNQLDSSCPPSLTLKREAIDLPARGVRGVYLHTGGENAGVIYWIFGGAFVGGSIKGSMGFAEQYGRRTGCDVFMIDMRLYPENGIQDAIIDACRGYEWLLTRTPAKKVLVYGLSSGGGIGLKLLQLAASTEDRATFFHAPSQKTPQPAGAILCGAWIRYTTPTYSMKEFTVVDWVVTQHVFEFIYPKLGDMCGGDELRSKVSPICNEMHGLCPLYISVSKHEVCVDENHELVQKAKKANVEVEWDEVPYMPHAFQWCTAFLPEAREADNRIVQWMLRKLSNGDKN